MNKPVSKLNDFTEKYRSEVDQALSDGLDQVTGKADQDFTGMLAYGLLNGGKRWRPLLTLMVLAGADRTLSPDLIRYASAVEWVHAYSLVHDDLPAMDNDQYRRGQLSLQAKYGAANAVLAGDALLTGAFEVLAGIETIPAKIRLEATQSLGRYAGARGMVLGQYHDLANHGESQYQNSQELLAAIYRPKTAALMTYAALAGAIVLAWPPMAQATLVRWADLFGLSYQIQDDLDDYQQDNGEDIQSLPHLVGLEKAQSLQADMLEMAKVALRDLMKMVPGYDASLLIDLTKQLGEQE
ncbi:polyprenyl synthetase family protein [Leuconostocaceae bacterium ESL0723]|nr:polyprenyl synthetase family protein [Leuconostocaceae bacterium ESL0723]